MSNPQNAWDQHMAFDWNLCPKIWCHEATFNALGAGSCCTQERGFPPVFGIPEKMVVSFK